MTSANPGQPVWKNFTRDREFPFSTVGSLLIHGLFFGLITVSVLVNRSRNDAIEIEPVTWTDPPGAGTRGSDSTLRQGIPQGIDVMETLAQRPIRRIDDDPPPPAIKIDTPQPVLPDEANREPAPPLKPLPQLASFMKGMPSGSANKGSGGPGPGSGGVGQGSAGTGAGPDGAGHISQKTKRQLRWTLLFTTAGAADYLQQLQILKAEMGVQAKDGSTRMVRDLSRRPALLESSRPPAERIFWMDDNAASVRALAEELRIDGELWRMIAFFPESLEKQLLEKELLYGKGFGRKSEDDIKETKFRVEIRYGQAKISVVEQQGFVNSAGRAP